MFASLESKIVGLMIVIVLAFGGGWTVRGWKESQSKLDTLNEQVAAMEASNKRMSEAAGKLETRLSELRKHEKVLRDEIQKILDRPVYSVECVDSDGLLLVEAARTGKPTKPADPVR